MRRRPRRAHPSQGSPRVLATRSRRSRSSSDGTPDSPTRPLESDLEWTPAELAERRVSRTLAGEPVLLCPEGNRHQPAPLIAYTLSWRDPDRRRRIAVVRHERFSERDDAGPRSPDTRVETRHTGEKNGHDHFARHHPLGAAARRRWIFLQTQGVSRKRGGALRAIARRRPVSSRSRV